MKQIRIIRGLWRTFARRGRRIMAPASIIAITGAALAAILLLPNVSAQQDTEQAAPARAAQPSDEPQSYSEAPTREMIGWGIFQQTCLGCHGRPEYAQAPSPAELRTYSPEKIYAALTTGPMKSVGDKLTDTQRKLVADAVSGRNIGSSAKGDAKDMPNQCSANPPMSDPSAGPQWNGWGNNADNTRFQPAADAGLTASQVSHLKLKWAFGLPNSISSSSEPTVVSGRVFFGTDTGYIYSLDAQTGCVYWSFFADGGGVRNALTIEPATHNQAGARYVAYFGDLRANMYAIDAETGKLIWKTAADPEYFSRITAPPAYYNGVLFVPISSWEEFSAKSLTYSCCTSIGSVVALDADNGQHLWQRFVIAQKPKPTRKNSAGVQQFAPAGGAVWNTPVVDPKRNAIYFGSGDGTTYPAPKTIDSVMALNMETGKVLWSYQAHTGDSFLVGCQGKGVTDNCPKEEGPDWDIPVSPILTQIPSGQRMIVVATKPGDVFALDPDHHGALLWRVNATSPKLAADIPMEDAKRLPGMIWGGAVDNDNVYYGLTRGGGMVALSLKDGHRVWLKSLGSDKPNADNATPVTLIPGVAFLGGMDGQLYAVSTTDGSVLWNFATDRAFETVNKVPAHGGALSSQGISVVGGMAFTGSGYGRASNFPGNVVLAFAPAP